MEEQYDDFIKYVQGNLDKAGKEKVEAQVESNAQAQEDLSFLEDLAQVSAWKGMMEEAHEELEEAEESDKVIPITAKKQEAKVRSIGFRRILSYAASVSLLIMALGVWHANTNYSNGSLASSTELDLLADTNLKSEGQVLDPFQQGIEALNRKDYAAAANFFGNIPTSSENYIAAKLYLAYTQFEQKNYPKAVSNAQLVATQSQTALTRHRAEWLQVQALLANGQETAYRPLLEKIINDPTHTFNKSAIALQEKIGSFWRVLTF